MHVSADLTGAGPPHPPASPAPALSVSGLTILLPSAWAVSPWLSAAPLKRGEQLPSPHPRGLRVVVKTMPP